MTMTGRRWTGRSTARGMASTAARATTREPSPCSPRRSLLDLVFLRRLDVHQPLDEEVPAPPHHVVRRGAVAVVLVRQQDEIEVLVGLDQRIRDQHRLVRRYVG